MLRQHDVSDLSAGDLLRVRRELAASAALAREGSPIRDTIDLQIAAIDAERTKRDHSLRLCGCGFATTDSEWMNGHLFENAGHTERGAEQLTPAWTRDQVARS
jgi:hypothetical protein